MRLLPETSGCLECVDLHTLPPGALVTGLMKLPMMTAAEGNSKLITNLKADRARLRKAQMAGIGWLTPTDQTRL